MQLVWKCPQVMHVNVTDVFDWLTKGYLDEMHNIAGKQFYNKMESIRDKTVCHYCHTLTAWMDYQICFSPSPLCHKE